MAEENIRITLENDDCPPEGLPCRDTAVETLRRRIEVMEKEIVGLRHLMKFLEKAEAGSPLEETVWGMLIRDRQRGW